MMRTIILEIIGVLAILGIQNIWIIDGRESIIGLIYLISITIAYLTVNKKWHQVSNLLKDVVSKRKIEQPKGKEYRDELKIIGIYIGCFSLVGIPIVVGLCNWVFVTLNIITRGISITGAIILYMLYMQTIIIIPLTYFVRHKECKIIKKSILIDNL